MVRKVWLLLRLSSKTQPVVREVVSGHQRAGWILEWLRVRGWVAWCAGAGQRLVGTALRATKHLKPTASCPNQCSLWRHHGQLSNFVAPTAAQFAYQPLETTNVVVRCNDALPRKCFSVCVAQPQHPRFGPRNFPVRLVRRVLLHLDVGRGASDGL